MAITPQAGYEIDPNNSNAVRKIQSTAMPGSIASINSQNIQQTTPVSINKPVDNTNYAGILAGAQQQALSLQQQVQATQPQQEAPKQESNSIQDYIKAIQGVQQPSATQTYQQSFDQSGLNEKQADVNAKAQITAEAQGRLNNISAQLTALNTEAQAIPIQLQQDSEGRGRTAAGLAPIQADQLRANALKALPLQAQAAVIQAEVATAQGNQKLAQDLYTQAQDHFDKMFTLQMQDAQRQYESQVNLIDKVFEFADRDQQRQLDAISKQADRDYEAQQDEIAYQNQLNRDKLEYERQVRLVTLKSELDNKKIPSGQITVSVVNPTTGKVDPRSQISNIINQTGAKTDDKLKLTGAVISAVQGFAENNLTGPISGLGFGSLVPGLFASQKTQDNRTSLSALEGTVESWMTGASVSEDQQKRIKEELIPKRDDSDGQVRRKINALANFMMNYAAGSLSTQGVSWTPEKIDFFTPVVITSPDGQEWQ